MKFNQPQPCELSIVSRKYLCEFDRIIKVMSERMLFISVSTSITVDFIGRIIPHYESSIWMCENILLYTTNVVVQNTAINIVCKNKKAIEIIKKIESRQDCNKNTPHDIVRYMDQYKCIIKSMISAMGSTLRLNNINLNFVNGFISHQACLIKSYNNILKFEIDKMLREFLINSLESEKELIKKSLFIRKALMNNCPSIVV